MALYQNTSVDSDRIVIGNYKLETAPSAVGTYVNLGAGQLTSWQHQFEKYNVQAGNAPDPIEGIADETVSFAFDLIEYDASVLSVLQCGLTSSATATSSSSLYAGGNTTLTHRAWRLTNRRIISGATVQTVITVFRGVIDNGMTMVLKSDNDADPVNAYQFSVTGEVDASLTVGSQLYQIVKDEV
jgi:hypothetical protein